MNKLLTSGASALALLVTTNLSLAAVTTYTVTLSGDQQSPPVTTAATGSGTLQHDTDTNLLTGTITFSGLSGAATGAHVHKGTACTNGSVLEGMSTSSPITVNVPVQGADLTALMAGGLYVNIHTAQNANGEIRGQILPTGQSVVSCATDAGTDAGAAPTPDASTPDKPTTTPTPDPKMVPDDAGTESTPASEDSSCAMSPGPVAPGVGALVATALALIAARARRRRA